ncbi:MAG: YbbR-like domain-containing protein [Desulfobacterium sp.]|nr:YbbR-like domain-containing protein [Desulfobacterium sp.]
MPDPNRKNACDRHRGSRMGRLVVITALVIILLTGCSPEPVETNLLVPLGFSSPPSNLVKMPSHATNLEIRIKGSSRLIKRASQEDLSYLVDLYTDLALDPAGTASTIDPGLYSIPVMEERIPLHPRIDIISITPSFITVRLEKKLVKRLPVHVPYTGKPAPGYTVLDAATDPMVVEVIGAESALDALTFILTKPVDISNARENFKKNLPLDLDFSATVETATAMVVATVPIVETIVTQTFEQIPITTKNAPPKTTIVPATMEIKVKGPHNTLKKSGFTEQFRIYIDLEGLTPGVYVRRAVIELPVGLILADTRPELFTVTIE